MTTSIVVTHEAMCAVRAATRPGHDFDYRECRQRADGMWVVPLSQETVQRIAGVLLPGESISECIIRLVRLSQGLRAS
jgi:hypothetical protein